MTTMCRRGVQTEHIETSEESGVDKKWQWSWPWTRRSNNKSVPLSEAQLKDWFRRFDTNHDGRLSKEELKAALEGLGSSFPAWRTWRALRHADENGDGYISEDELSGLVKYIVKRGYSP
ncbi:hypothetical protein JRO89_XS07G0066700 [Xanthoceras sorbifolium]|uniref:EF-hand domain-containing protein n=1 Tax=Xanthoceras sorbifolium TaxID=99658 RepID=A0ABQ8HSX2_9ROSI|nr:hypothetical protein JRO89_XS07G0066700 [Xanthoceras sorbifolium]